MAYRVASFAAYFLLFSCFVSISRCDCPIGYSGSPCKVRHCEPLSPPLYAGILGDCFTEYLSVCYMECFVGYVPSGGSNERKCEVNASGYMEWSGTPLQCQVRRCESLSPPSNGYIVGDCLRYYSSVCSMECNEGYEAVGRKERACVLDASGVMVWSGSPLQCRG